MLRLLLNNSSENIKKSEAETISYLDRDKTSFSKIRDCLISYRYILDLIPETLSKLFSGHIFPYTESYIEIENSVHFCLMGFYKAALISLRSCLELGLLCIYYDREDNSETIIKEWLRSQEPTPFKRTIINGLTKIDNVTSFNFKLPILNSVSDLYSELSNYVHTKGVRYSSYQLNHSNVNNFNKKTFAIWLGFLERVITSLSTLFLLKYPVGLLYTPLDEKFGFNGPAGGFLNPHQVSKILNMFDEETRDMLKDIGERDDAAQSLSKAINYMPDISDQEVEKQADEIDREDIKNMGFKLWYKNMIEPTLDYSDEVTGEMKKKIIKHEEWAKDNGYYH